MPVYRAAPVAIFVLVGAVAHPTVHAQDRPLTVRGVVLDGNRNPVQAALVYVDSGRVHTRSDSAGAFTLSQVPPGEHILHLRGMGFAPRAFRMILVERPGPPSDAYVGEIALRPGPSPTLSLVGVITDRMADQPVPGVEVLINGTLATFTDMEGKFLVRRAAANWGPNTVTVRRIGYDGATAEVWIETADARVRLSLEVTPFAVKLPEVSVEGDRAVYAWGDLAGFFRRKRAGYGEFYTAADIAERNPRDLAALFANAPGVVVRGDRMGRNVVRFLRGPGECLPVYYVDGLEMISQLDLAETINPLDIEGIEMYSGNATIPLQFGESGNECGAIVIWMKRRN